MRFELSNSPPPHLNRRLQLRMLGFVGLIGLVMFSMALFRPKQENKLPGDPNAAVQPDESIFQVKEGKSELKEGEFVSEPWQEPPPAGTGSAESLEQEVQRLETHLDKSILRRVKDNELGIRRDEADAYYRVLEHARRMPTRDLERSGATDVLYINLMTQPDRFRGDPITIQGDLWRLYEFEAGPNPYGFKTLYEAWIFTGDSSNHPYRVVFSRLPRDLEPGENLRKPVRVTGYFFKREGYASNGGLHVAPTLLAQRVISYRPPEMAPSTDAIVPYMVGLVSAVGLAFLVTLVSFAISDRRAARAALARELNAPRPSFEGLQVPPVLSVKESLQKLEESEWQAEADATDPEYDEVSAKLHARDRDAASRSDSHASGQPATDTASRIRQLRTGAKAVQEWTNHHSPRSDSGMPPGPPADSSF